MATTIPPAERQRRATGEMASVGATKATATGGAVVAMNCVHAPRMTMADFAAVEKSGG